MELANVVSALLPLALLACPVAMGLMMWMMSRGNKQRESAPVEPRPMSVEVLREEQRRIGEQIERLDAGDAQREQAGGRG